MKKIFLFFIICFFSVSAVFSQSSVEIQNRNTALKYLEISKECMTERKWESALNQINIGLSYDEKISDLLYLKANVLKILGEKNADVLAVALQAFEIDSWYEYSKKSAGILLADLLCDTGKYEDSLNILDELTNATSSDAEFIRIKNYYRMGTVDSLDNARKHVDSARRVFPNDTRFPLIFFMFESMFKNEAEIRGVTYKIPENVQTIANSYIRKFPDYSNLDDEIEIYALFLTEDETVERMVKSISAKSMSENVLLVIAQMKIGMISNEQAFENFFDYTDGIINLNIFELFISCLSDENVKQMLVEKMTNFGGTILIDEDLDLQSELSVRYSLGRPQYISYDKNNDGIKDIYCSCDYGTPISIIFESEKTELFYDIYPSVNKIHYIDDDYSFNFLNDDFSFIPFEMEINNRMNEIGLDFYIPKMSSELSIPSPYDLVLTSSSVELPIDERIGAKVVYTTLKGELVFANFYDADLNYAYCDFSEGLPFVRYVDYDGDGTYETAEVFNKVPEDYVKDEDDQSCVEKVFSKVLDDQNLYLQKVTIDRNSNTFNEFSEEYLASGGVITSWDYDDNGIIDCQFIQYPLTEDNSIVEESIFYDNNGIEIVSLFKKDGIPVKMISKNEESAIYPGDTEDFYWVDEPDTIDVEDILVDYINNDLTQGVVELVKINSKRYTVIKIGNEIFAKMIPYGIR